MSLIHSQPLHSAHWTFSWYESWIFVESRWARYVAFIISFYFEFLAKFPKFYFKKSKREFHLYFLVFSKWFVNLVKFSIYKVLVIYCKHLSIFCCPSNFPHILFSKVNMNDLFKSDTPLHSLLTSLCFIVHLTTTIIFIILTSLVRNDFFSIFIPEETPHPIPGPLSSVAFDVSIFWIFRNTHYSSVLIRSVF